MISFLKKKSVQAIKSALVYSIDKLEKNYTFKDLGEKHISNTKLLVDREEMLKLMPKNATVAELGVNKGDFSKKILETTNASVLHLVDIWDSKRYNKEIYKEVKSKFKDEISSGKVVINLGLSTEVVKDFNDEYFDWIYIDTDHSYATTKAELELYSKKVKKNGIIAGHDFVKGSWLSATRYGVIEAVYEFCFKNDWEIIYLTMENRGAGSFAIKKI